MIDINKVNERLIHRINWDLFSDGDKNLTELFECQIMAVTNSRIFRETRDISNAETIELPNHPHLNYIFQSNPELITAVAVGFYVIEASKVGVLQEGCHDYFTKWNTNFVIPPTALDLVVYTKECDLLEERINLVNAGGHCELRGYFYEPEIYQDARHRVTDEHSVLDELLLQLR